MASCLFGVLFAFGYDMGAGCPLEECAAPHAGRVDGRAATACARVERGRPPLSLWWLSSPGLVFGRRESDGVIFLGRSLAPLVCKKGRVCR